MRAPAGPGVPVATDVPVSLSSGALGEDFLSGSDREFAESQSFSLSRKWQAFLIESQGGLSMENSAEELSPTTRRKIQEVGCGVDHGWAAVYQAVAKRMFDHQNKCEVMNVHAQECLSLFCRWVFPSGF